jgi:hypothetical protein
VTKALPRKYPESRCGNPALQTNHHIKGSLPLRRGSSCLRNSLSSNALEVRCPDTASLGYWVTEHISSLRRLGCRAISRSGTDHDVGSNSVLGSFVCSLIVVSSLGTSTAAVCVIGTDL